MTLTSVAALGGFGFVLVGAIVNIAYGRARLPLPTSGHEAEEIADAFSRAGAGRAFRRASVLAPLSWLCLTVFAAGLLSELWSDVPGSRAWALVGFGGVLLQNATFTCVEALRFAVARSAREARSSVPGLWSLSVALFGFNQAFLTTALLGLTIAGLGVGLIPVWHAVVGFVSASLLFVSAALTPYRISGPNRSQLVGLVGWLGWIAWIIIYSVLIL